MRVSGSIAGVIIVIVVGLAFATAVNYFLGMIGKVIGSESANKKLNILCRIVWILSIFLIILDLTGIFPLIRRILFALMD